MEIIFRLTTILQWNKHPQIVYMAGKVVNMSKWTNKLIHLKIFYFLVPYSSKEGITWFGICLAAKNSTNFFSSNEAKLNMRKQELKP